jgi:hypothetical protein
VSGRLSRSHEVSENGPCEIRTRGLVCPTATTRSSGRQPRPKRCPFAVIVITSESRASLSHLVQRGSQLGAAATPHRATSSSPEDTVRVGMATSVLASWRLAASGSNVKATVRGDSTAHRPGSCLRVKARAGAADGRLLPSPNLECSAAGFPRSLLSSCRLAARHRNGDEALTPICPASRPSGRSDSPRSERAGRARLLTPARSRGRYATCAFRPVGRCGSVALSREGSGRRRCGRDGWFAAQGVVCCAHLRPLPPARSSSSWPARCDRLRACSARVG